MKIARCRVNPIVVDIDWTLTDLNGHWHSHLQICDRRPSSHVCLQRGFTAFILYTRYIDDIDSTSIASLVRTLTVVGLQRGFTAFIAPLHCGIAALLPRLAPLAARLAATRAAWEARGADEDAALEAEAAALPWGSAQSPSR